MAAIHQVPCLCAECEQICKGKLEERERRLVSAKEQRKRHEVANDRNHIKSTDQCKQHRAHWQIATVKQLKTN